MTDHLCRYVPLASVPSWLAKGWRLGKPLHMPHGAFSALIWRPTPWWCRLLDWARP